MLYIKQVMELFGCDMETARKVVQGMVLDFSEVTDAQFKREAEFIWFQMITREQEELS